MAISVDEINGMIRWCQEDFNGRGTDSVAGRMYEFTATLESSIVVHRNVRECDSHANSATRVRVRTSNRLSLLGNPGEHCSLWL